MGKIIGIVDVSFQAKDGSQITGKTFHTVEQVPQGQGVGERTDHFFLSSANAVTDDGVLVNIDGNSNRVSCIAQGPKKVIFIVGINKVCPDLDSAMKRARNVAATANAQRFDIKTPCKETGKCFDCKSPDTICCQFLITRYSRHKDRIHVILVNDTLGL